MPARAIAAALWLLGAAGCATAPRSQAVVTDYLPALDLQSVGPSPATVEALRGRVLLVSFTATWCFPCIQELPDLIALHQKFAAQGFTVVLVGMDLEGATVLEAYADYYALPFPMLIADADVRGGKTAFGSVRQLPTSVLLGKDGKPAAVWVGVANPPDLEAAVARALR